MNFVAKNLGWLLLLAFFIFMLFVISSSDSSKSISNSWALSLSWVSVDWKEAKDSGLQELVDKINTDEGTWAISEVASSEIVAGKQEDVKNEPWFLSRIFSRKWKEDTWDDMSNSGSISKDEESSVNENEEDISNTTVSQKLEENLIVESTSTSKNTQVRNLKKGNRWKKVDYAMAKKYAPEVLGLNLPGVNLNTKVWNNYEIWVHSLKINNKNFTRKLGYLMKGDVITQLTPANSYGCFQMQVLSSSISTSNGKTWYVCKKYLSETSKTPHMQATHDVKEEVIADVIVEHPTKIGDIITVEKDNIPLADIILTPWDVLDQMSDTDENGCFTTRVHMSVNTWSLSKAGKVCNSQLY